jgi:hypothetical protein
MEKPFLLRTLLRRIYNNFMQYEGKKMMKYEALEGFFMHAMAAMEHGK